MKIGYSSMNARHDASYKHLFSSPKVEERGRGHHALLPQRMLRRRFGPLPEWAQQRLRSASSEELETWADRVLDAQRLEDVFEGRIAWCDHRRAQWRIK